MRIELLEGARWQWLLDPIRRHAEFYQLDEGGLFQPMKVEDGIFRSVILDGLWLDLGWLWQEPSPPLMSVLRQWKLL